MKTYIKPIFIGLIGLILLVSVFALVLKLYNDFRASQEETVQEVQMDLTTLYPEASGERLEVIVDGDHVEPAHYPKYVDGTLYIPADLVIEYMNDQFFYDTEEGVLTYTTMDDVIRMRTDELTYTVNDEPLKLTIGMTTFDDMAYLPVSLLQKFVHHDFILGETYHTLQIEDWYGEKETGEVYYEPVVYDEKSHEPVDTREVYIRQLPDESSPYIHKTYVGMTVRIVGEDGDFYQVLTREGFIGYINKEWIRSETTIDSMKEKVSSYDDFPSKDFDGKLSIVWHQVFNMTANQAVQERFTGATGLDVISPTWFELEGTEGDVRSIADLEYVRWAHANGYQVWALFANLGDGYTRAMTYDVLSSTDKRMEVIRQLLAYVALYELDGINIDLENISEDTGPYYVQFVKELSVYLKQQGVIVSVDVPVPRPWTEHMKRGTLGEYVDYVIIMGYDEHWSTSPESGSVASIGFARDGVIDTMAMVPAEKIVLGVPFYTRLWKEEVVDGELQVSNSHYGMKSGPEKMAEEGAELQWDEETGQYYGEYERDGATYKMWVEDERSIATKLDLVTEFNLAGMAGWKSGFESDTVWETIEESMNP